MSLKSKPTAKKKNTKRRVNDKRKKRCTNVSFHNQLQTTWLRKTQKKTKQQKQSKVSMECSYLLTHGPWMVQSTALVLFQLVKAHWHTCTRTHIETLNTPAHGGGRRGGVSGRGGGQHERTRPWTTEADIRRGGGGRGNGGHGVGSGVTTGRHHSTGALQKHVQQWGRGRGQGHSSLRVSSGIAVFFFFYSKRWTHPMARGEKKLLVQ